jgi:hypothetical protein
VTLLAVTTRPTADQITKALSRAVETAREHTKYPDRILKKQLPKYGSEPCGERWSLIGQIRVLGQPSSAQDRHRRGRELAPTTGYTTTLL